MNEKVLEEKVKNFGEEKMKLEQKLINKYEPHIQELEGKIKETQEMNRILESKL
jgi:hypothetical protein